MNDHSPIAGPPTILVVDDRAINREFLMMLLGYAGYRVIEAGQGAAALKLARREPVALIISDILMPVMDGVEFAQRLRADPAIAHIPIIFYTATYRAHEARVLAQTCGVATVLAKPSEPQAILDAVSAALHIAQVRIEDPVYPGQKTPRHPEVANLQHRLQAASLAPPALATGTMQASEGNSLYARGNLQALSLRTAALLELGMTISLERDPQQLIELFCRAAQDIMNSRYAAVGMRPNGQPRRHAQCGLTEAEIDAIFEVLDAETGCLHAVLFDGNLLRTRDIANHPAISDLPAAHPLRRSALLLPIVLRSHPYGWLYVADKLGVAPFNEEDEEFAVTLAAQLAPGYENLVLYDEVHRHVGALEREIVERKRVGDALQASEIQFRQLAENIPEVFFLINRDYTEMLYVSPAYEQIWGRTCASLYAAARSWTDAIHPDDLDQALKYYEQRNVSEKAVVEYRIVRPDGEIRWIRARISPVRNHGGKVYRFAGIAEDITEQILQARRIDRLSRLYAVLSGINSAIVRLRDRDELFQEACRVAVHHGAFNMAWIGVIDPITSIGTVVASCGGTADFLKELRITALPDTPHSNRPASVAIREQRPVICNHVRIDAAAEPFRATLLAHGHESIAAWPLITSEGVMAVMVLLASETDFFDEDECKLLDELAGDLSFGLEFIDKEEKLSYLSYYDVLTGLPNATVIRDRLTQMLSEAGQDGNMVAVIVVDLQNFAQLNNAMGRHAGDMILKDVARRLDTELIKPSVLARISGDMFAVVIPALHHGAEAIGLLEKQIFKALQRPFMLNDQAIRLGARAGLALFPEDGDNAETLFQHAEIALNRAKASGERYLYFAAHMNVTIAARLALESELRDALEKHQFTLHYQPRIDLANGRIVSAEALIRWQHPQRGQVSPDAFIPLAEETGLIVSIGAWVIQSVCAQQAAWQALGIKIVPVAINLSAVQLKHERLLGTIADALKANGIASQYIEFELTESAVMNDPEKAARDLHELKALGVKLSLDDFGTGYSSLAYLKRFPFDIVKIDRSFVADLARSPEDAAIVIAVIAMAHSLNLRVVAEGVETEAQLQYLRKHRCDELQGYYFSPPIPATGFEAMLREGKRLVLKDAYTERRRDRSAG